MKKAVTGPGGEDLRAWAEQPSLGVR